MVHPHREDEPASACGSGRIAERVLLIGWDGADWSVLRRLLSEGRLPHLASLLEKGACLELVAPRPHETAVVWTSLATGKRPHEHGVLHSRMSVAGWLGRAAGVRDQVVAVAAIWNILGRANLRSHIVGWPVTHPAESISGICVSDCFAVPRLHSQSRERGEQSAVSPARGRRPIAGTASCAVAGRRVNAVPTCSTAGGRFAGTRTVSGSLPDAPCGKCDALSRVPLVPKRQTMGFCGLCVSRHQDLSRIGDLAAEASRSRRAKSAEIYATTAMNTMICCLANSFL